MSKQIIKDGQVTLPAAKFKVTDRPLTVKAPEVEQILAKYHLSGSAVINKKAYREVQAAIKKYPNEPTLYNMHYNMLLREYQEEKALAVLHKMHKLFPDYLFARAAVLIHYCESDEWEKVPDILGYEPVSIGTDFPDREVFHFSEVNAYTLGIIHYLTAQNKIEEVNREAALIRDFHSDSELTELEEKMSFLRIKRNMNHFMGNKSISPTVIPKKFEKKKERTKLILPVLDDFFEEDLDDAVKFLPKILALPRESLVSDLLNVLQDVLHGQDRDGVYAAFHSFILLTALDVKEAAPIFLDFLRRDEDFYDEQIGDYGEYFAYNLALLTADNPAVLVDYFYEPNHYEFAKNIVLEALFFQFHLFPEKQEQSRKILIELAEFFVREVDNPDINNPTLSAFYAAELMRANLEDGLPFIKQLSDKGQFSETICGSYTEVEKQLKNPKIGVKCNLFTSAVDLFGVWADTVDFKQNFYDSEDLDSLKPVRFDFFGPDRERPEEWLEDENDDEDDYRVSEFVKTLKASDFSKYGRNDKVDVVYEDGKIVLQVKFKKVESDLRDRKCKLK